jgi:hypothetical protein
MILPTMSLEETLAHAQKELLAIESRLSQIIPKACSKALRYNRSTLTFTITAPNRTVFTIYISDTRKKYATVGAWFESKHGKSFIIPAESGCLIFRPHFFQRYAERFLHNTHDAVQAQEHFFYRYKFLGVYKGIEFGIFDDRANVAVIYEQGVGLGVAEEGDNWILNTFVSNDLLFPSQLAIADRIRNASINGDQLFIMEGDDGPTNVGYTVSKLDRKKLRLER